MQESVTSVSKKESSIGVSAAAIAVLSPEEIARFGATTVPEALRLVPVRTYNRYLTFFPASWRYFNDNYGVVIRWVLEKQ